MASRGMGGQMTEHDTLKLLIILCHAAAITFLLQPLTWFSDATNEATQAKPQQPEPSPRYFGISRLF